MTPFPNSLTLLWCTLSLSLLALDLASHLAQETAALQLPLLHLFLPDTSSTFLPFPLVSKGEGVLNSLPPAILDPSRTLFPSLSIPLSLAVFLLFPLLIISSFCHHSPYFTIKLQCLILH